MATFLLLASMFLVLLRAAESQREATNDAVRAAEALSVAGTVERLIVDMQTGQRGFLITEDKSFLEPFDRAVDQYPDTFERLLATAKRGPERRLVVEIGTLATRYRYGYLEQLIDLARRDVQAARQVVARGEGKRRVDQIRGLFDQLSARKRDAVRDSRGEADLRGERARSLALVGLGLTAVILVIFISFLRSAVVAPVRRLADAAERVAGGDLTARTRESSSANELAQMSVAFNEMAESLQEAFQAARGAEAARDEFFALVSHELRTPLTSIVGYVELLQEDASGADPLSAEERRRFLGVVNRNSRRLLRLVGDLLFVARLEAGRLDLESLPFDPVAPAREAVEAAQPRARDAQVQVGSELEEGLLVAGDEGRLGQALDNLLSNAIKFTPAGGRVTVRLAGDGSHAVLEVIDTGVGIPVAEQEQLFERFFRASTGVKVEGVGLGLVITKAIVEGHGGRLELESAEGAGSTFRLLLPLADGHGG